MSKEVKEKIDLNPKYILLLTFTLLITCAIVAGLLGFVNSITQDRIEQFNVEKTNAALSLVFQDAADPTFPELEISQDMIDQAATYGATLENVYDVQSGGASVGTAIKLYASGSQGNIEMVVGIGSDGIITGVSIVNNAETSGIGSKVMGNEPLASGVGVLDQFQGKSAADQPLEAKKNIDVISGATVSTKGVTAGVNGALAAAAAIG